jgi:hypothetical protein
MGLRLNTGGSEEFLRQQGLRENPNPFTVMYKPDRMTFIS